MSVRTRLVGGGALGCVVVAGIGFVAQPWLRADAMYPWKSAVLLAAMMAVALRFAAEHPFPRLGPGNRVTMVRAMVVALVAALIDEPATTNIAGAAVALGAVAAVLDGVDGWLARRTGMSSAFGGRMDMETDALLILVLSVLVWRHDKAGAWVLASGLVRYAFVAAGWLVPWMAAPLTPTLRGKAMAIAQITGLCVALAPITRPPFSSTTAAAALAALIWSFATDVGRLWRTRASGEA